MESPWALLKAGLQAPARAVAHAGKGEPQKREDEEMGLVSSPLFRKHLRPSGPTLGD